MMVFSQTTYSSQVKVGLSLLLLLVALIPRVVQLNQYLGPDEMAQWNRSNQFFLSLLKADWASTHRGNDTGNLTLMWLESGGITAQYLWQRLQGQSISLSETVPVDRPIEKLAEARLIVALANALLVLAVFWAVASLFNGPIGFITALLIALDPFFLSESRMIRSEALYTAFMGLTVILFLLYLKERRWLWLLLSGILAGLSIASKISGLFLIGFIPLSFTIHTGLQLITDRSAWRAGLKQWLVGHGVWGICCSVTLVILWPALWVQPLTILQSTQKTVEYSGLQGKTDSRFFMGIIWDNLPNSYYLAVIPFRITPLVMVGVLLLLIGLLVWVYHQFRQRKREIPFEIFAILTLIGYATLYMGIFSLAANKTDRYILITLWTLDILASVGLVGGVYWLTQQWSKAIQQAIFTSLAGLVILWQSYTVSQLHPYYEAYYNPWLGGHSTASQIFQLGYGAGVKQLMTHLNQHPNANELSVVCGTNEPRCEQIFQGETWQRRTLNPVNGQWVLADYVLLYITQKQRGLYPDGVVDYLERQPAEQIAIVNGLPYAWLYQAPQATHYGQAAKLDGVGTLLGYDMFISEAVPANHSEHFQASHEVTWHSWWQNHGTQAKTMVVRVIDLAGYVWAEAPLPPMSSFETASQQLHQIVESKGTLRLPPGMPAGEYFLRFGFQLADDPTTFLRFKIPIDETAFMVTAAPLGTGVPTAETPLNMVVAEGLTLVGHDLMESMAQAGQELWLPLIWQTTATINRDYVILIRLVGADQVEAAFWLGRPLQSSQSTNNWQAGQIIEDPWHLILPHDIEPGTYQWELALFDADTQAEINRLPLGTLELLGASQ